MNDEPSSATMRRGFPPASDSTVVEETEAAEETEAVRGGQGASTAEEVEEAVVKNSTNSQPELWRDFSKMMGGDDR